MARRLVFRGAQSTLAQGTLTIHREGDELRLATEAKGEIARLLPRPYAGILAGRTQLDARATLGRGQSYRLDRFRLDAPRIKAAASGRLDLARSQFAGDAEIQLRDTLSGQPLTLDFGGDGASVELGEAHAIFSAKPGADGIAISGTVETIGAAVEGNRADRVSLHLSARQPNGVGGLLKRLEAIKLTALVQNPQLTDNEFQPLAGERVALEISGAKAGEKLIVEDAVMSAGGGTAVAKGALAASGFDGEIGLAVPDAAPLSRLAGRELGGTLRLTGKGRAGFDGAFNFALDGKGESLTAGSDQLGRLLAGSATLTGTMSRRADGGVRFDDLALRNDALDLSIDGGVGGKGGDARLRGRIVELSRLLPDSSGSLTIEAALDERAVTAKLSAAEATIRGKPVHDLSIAYEGRGGMENQRGTFSASGRIGDARLAGAGRLTYSDAEGPRIDAFKLALGGNAIEADAALPAGGEARGTARIHIADASELSPILGVPLSGGGTVDIGVSGSADAPRLTIKASSGSLSYDAIRLEAAQADIDIADALKRPALSGTAGVKSLTGWRCESRGDQIRRTEPSRRERPRSQRPCG
ncbi:MAG: hypothetical protein HC850_15710 [Rhodomicrobium sp.]|nr:hypothetical protein [Rhodomicrobium sp.]